MLLKVNPHDCLAPGIWVGAQRVSCHIGTCLQSISCKSCERQSCDSRIGRTSNHPVAPDLPVSSESCYPQACAAQSRHCRSGENCTIQIQAYAVISMLIAIWRTYALICVQRCWEIMEMVGREQITIKPYKHERSMKSPIPYGFKFLQPIPF